MGFRKVLAMAGWGFLGGKGMGLGNGTVTIGNEWNTGGEVFGGWSI